MSNSTSFDVNNCKKYVLDFVIREDDPEMAVVEDDIAADLAKIGITVKTRKVNDTEYIRLEENGDYNLFFTRSWGAPYDPHTYLNSWNVPSHVEFSATKSLEAPLTRELLMERIQNIQTLLDEQEIAKGWKSILEDIHRQAIFVPLWGTRVPYVLNRRLVGFTPSSQTYSYPLETVRVLQGSKNVTMAAGASGSGFDSAGPMHPHQYSPNVMFTQAWIYESLVGYGQDGLVTPALATSWKTEPMGEGQQVTFALRQGVKFHDGTDFDCAAVKLNFDHVLSPTASNRHSWIGAVQALESWECNDNGEFVMKTKTPFYPLLQELSYIRPFTIASPATFASGENSHPELENSCNPGDTSWQEYEAVEGFNCAGLTEPAGTGPFKFVSRELREDGTDDHVLFQRHDDYWGEMPDIEFIELRQYDSTQRVFSALLDGSIDLSMGIGPLTAVQIKELRNFHTNVVDVRHSDVLQHALIIMNTDKEPTSDIAVRQAIIHAVDKGRFIEEEFGGLEQPVGQVLPRSAPYCNVDLNPKWEFDLDKAGLLNCPEQTTTVGSSENSSSGGSDLSPGALAGIIVAVVAALGLAAFVVVLIRREKEGKPMFHANKKAETV